MDENTLKNIITAVTVDDNLCKDGVFTIKRANCGVRRN